MKLQPLVPLWVVIPYIVALAAAAGWYYWKTNLRGKDKKAAKPKAKDTRKWTQKVNWLLVRRGTLVLLPALVALGPSVQGGVSSPGVANLDVIFAVDTTPSMGAADYGEGLQRIEGVKQDLALLAKQLEGAHFEVISFDTEANVVLPMTSDATAFASALEGLTPQISSYSQGSGIDKPLALITQELKASQDAFPDRFRLLFYLGDGEQTAEAKVAAFTPAAKYVNGGAVLGYGTAKGAQMVKRTGLEDPNNPSAAKGEVISTIDTATNKLVPAISKLDANALKKIATELKLQYTDRNQAGPITDVYQSSKAQLAIDKSQRVIHYLNLYWLIAAIYGGLLCWELHILVSRLIEVRNQSGVPAQAKKTGGNHGR